MSAPSTCRILSQATRAATRSLRSRQANVFRPYSSRVAPAFSIVASSRCFSVSTRRSTGIMPDTENPSTPPRERDAQPSVVNISDEEYHTRADEYMDKVHEKAELIQEVREDVEVEYSAGVLSITFPPNGTYVLNKQPPNKQIWLASPITGPKRFDWTLQGESMNQKEGGGVGDWVYLRDGTTLSEVLRKELAITVDIDGHEETMKEKSLDPTE